MKKLILALFMSGNLFSQNWNVFNKNYRYNYKYNFSQLVTNVMFADTVRQSGTDTTYALNRIGVECTGSCPTITTALNPTVTYIVPNMPQFFQRSICKYSNGHVKLYDTTKIVIVPSCTLNQSWLFDSIYNKTAVCTNIFTLTVFGITDSVRTIMINNVDSLQLSKSFGILLFPDLYGKNKYYRLAGIENKNSYDQNSLHGEKVPNAWDFYNYQVGDEYCSFENWQYQPNQPSWCYTDKTVITGKSPLNGGFVYSVSVFRKSMYSPNLPVTCGAPSPPPTYSTNSYTYSTSSYTGVSYDCNLMYPGMIYPPNTYNDVVNVIKFGKDNIGNFYKFCGTSCNSQSPVTPVSAVGYYPDNNAGVFYQITSPGENYNILYAVGFGKIAHNYQTFEALYAFCVTKFLRNNVLYFGTSCPALTNIEENHINDSGLLFYPNPASSSITVPVPQKSQVEINNALGQTVFTSEAEGDQKIDISSFPNGIYFVMLKSSGYSVRQKLVISR
jgi:hypothetical protein